MKTNPTSAIVISKNVQMQKYEWLLLKRDEVQKEALHYQWEYIRVFGDLILKVFKKKIECIEKKKTIEYCQLYINRGEEPDFFKLQEYLDFEMFDFHKQLQDIVDDNDAAKNARAISEIENAKIKKIYKKLAKLIHPDINPKYADVPAFKELWTKINAAYKGNRLKELEELKVLVMRVLQENGSYALETEITGIYEKIKSIEAEIEQIKSVDPYQYKFLLEDENAVEEKKQELNDEYCEYEEYEQQLNEILAGMLNNGGNKNCQMN